MAARNSAKQPHLTAWYIGLVVIATAATFVAFRIWASDCTVPLATEALVILVMPVVYLILMYLTLTSQD